MKKNRIEANCKKYNSSNNTENFVLLGMLGITLLSGALLTLPSALADDSAATDVAITVPVACAVTSTVGTAHTALIDSGTYEDDIGTTTIKTTCNDSQGFSIYAIGYTNEEYGNTTLKPATLESAQYNIATGTATSGATSNWAMKLTASTGMTSANILSDTDGAYSNYHKVPTTYTKVATMNSSTNATTGASIEATYAAYIAGDQPADTYNGKVKYTMVHPASAPEPFLPHEEITASGKICYYPNTDKHEGTMGCQTIYSSNTSATLLASNFSRDGYGFAGWTDKYDWATNDTAKYYGPNETITFEAGAYTGNNSGLSLYAVWANSQGSLQDSDKVVELCGTNGIGGSLTAAPFDGTANRSSISALTDGRDNQTYAIAKLADGNCWMIENLRLESTADHNTDGLLAQGYGSSFVGLAEAESTWESGSSAANSLYSLDGSTAAVLSGDWQGYRFPRYNNLNTPANPSDRPQSPTSDSFSKEATTVGMYSYGNYYTWSAAIADADDYNYSSREHNTTSICPKGWRLPSGAQSIDDKSFGKLSVSLGGPEGGASANSSSTPTGRVMSNRFRSFPNNFIYSGSFYSDDGTVIGRGNSGLYWTSTNDNNFNAVYFPFYFAEVTIGPITLKYYGFTIRCVSGS